MPPPTESETSHIRVPSVDATTAFAIARATLKLIKSRVVRARLRVLPESELPSSTLDGYKGRLERAETGSAEYELARSGDTDARVPMALFDAGLRMSERMQSCLAYNLDDDAGVERQLAAIRRGSGHVDLAEDLAALSVLYWTHAAALRGDGKNYRASDAADSNDTAREVRASIAKGQRAVTRAAAQKWAKAYAALDASHNEIIAAGRYLDRKDPKLADRWVHLRSQPRRPPAKPG